MSYLDTKLKTSFSHSMDMKITQNVNMQVTGVIGVTAGHHQCRLSIECIQTWLWTGAL